MTCTCLPCADGKPCARVLMLAPKDRSDMIRLWSRFERDGTEPGPVNLKVQAVDIQRKREAAEPSELVWCSACGGQYALAVFLTEFLRRHRAPVPPCSRCEEARAA